MFARRFSSWCRRAVCGVVGLLATASPSVATGDVVIQEIYAAGGNAGATFNFDYVVLYNRSASAQAIAGWSVQYADATSNFGTAALKVDIPAGAAPLQPGQFYLVRLGSNNTAVGGALPLVPDVTSGNNNSPNYAAQNGKVALVRSTNLLPAVSCPLPNAIIEDFVGYGTTANCQEGAATAPSGNATSSVFRKNVFNGCVDTDQNGTDMQSSGAVCRNTTTAFAFCSVVCCDAAGMCTVVLNPAACNGAPLPNGACMPNPCPALLQGACCFNNNCFIGTQTQCQTQGGTYHGDGSTCANRNCGQGACCSPAGACVQVNTIIACVNGGGVFLGFGASCAPNPCTAPFGACCLTAGCFPLTRVVCENQGGTYAGDSVGCGAVNCDTGACCSATNVCTQVNTAQACVQGGGRFLGLGVACVPNPCMTQTGACCAPDGTCTQVTSAVLCNGTFQGFGVACTANTCKGACCLPTGVCTITGQGACSLGFQGLGTTCTPNPCPITPPGACCLPSGGCTGVANAGACAGTFLGAGTSCNPDPCVGVCCAGSTCLSITAAACTQQSFSIFVFTTLTCPGTSTEPCCRADFNHVGGVSVQDIFDFLNSWFLSSSLTDFNGIDGVTVADIFDFLNAWFAGC